MDATRRDGSNPIKEFVLNALPIYLTLILVIWKLYLYEHNLNYAPSNDLEQINLFGD